MKQDPEERENAPAALPKYQAPQAIPLGQLAKGLGEKCKVGSADSCAVGGNAGLGCNVGNNVGP